MVNKKIIVILFHEDTNALYDASGGYSENSGFFVPGTYFNELSTYPQISSFYTDAENLFSKSFRVNSWYENSFISIAIWIQALKIARTHTSDVWPTSDYVRISLLSVNYASPSGNIKITDANHYKRSLFLMETVNNGFSQVYPHVGRSITIDPSPFRYGTPTSIINKPNVLIFKYEKSVIISNYVIFAILMLLYFGTLVTVIHFRESRIIRTFGNCFNFIVILALAVGTVSLMLYYQTPESDLSCLAKVYSMSLFLILFQSSLFAKVLKIRAAVASRSVLKVNRNNII